jgi:hypothetical protein
MSKANIIPLSDMDGNVHYFEILDLASQLVNTELSGNNPPVKYAARNLGTKVLEMRRAQKNYFANARTADEQTRLRFLDASKKAESAVDALVPVFLQTIEKL